MILFEYGYSILNEVKEKEEKSPVPNMIRTNALRIGRTTLFMLGYKNCPGLNTLFVFMGSNAELWKSLSAKIHWSRWVSFKKC